jgi:two-component system, LytTR family, response regulator AgrA
MTLNFVLVDDEKPALDTTYNYVKKFIAENQVDANIALCTTLPQEVLKYSSNMYEQMNVYVLDINFESNINGVMLGRAIRDREPNAYIIYLTAYIHLSMMVFKYRLKALDFLVKPVSYSELQDSLKALLQDYSKLSSQCIPKELNFINVKSGYQEYRVPLTAIIYIESFGPKLIIHTVNGKIEYYGALRDVEKSISEMSSTFYRTHKSFLINSRYIKEISLQNQEITMSNGAKCLISRNKKSLLKAFCNSEKNIDTAQI